MSTRSRFFYLVLLIVSNATCANKTIQTGFLYEDLIPKLVKFDIEAPSEQEQIFINMCHAHQQGGTQFPKSNKELWQAVNSIAIFDIVAQYMPKTITLSGRIALARQYAMMNDDFDAINNKTALQSYLAQNPSFYEKLQKIITYGQHGEIEFSKLFKILSEEEQEEYDRIHKQLYFTSFGLDKLNENEWAVGCGPRVNQLHTTAWCTIPPMLASGIHSNIMHHEKYRHLKHEENYLPDIIKAGSVEQYQSNLKKEINDLKEKQQQSDNYWNWELNDLETKLSRSEQYKTKTITELKQDLSTLSTRQKEHVKSAPHVQCIQQIRDRITAKDTQSRTEAEQRFLNRYGSGEISYYTLIREIPSSQDKRTFFKTYAKNAALNIPRCGYDIVTKGAQQIYKEATEHNLYRMIKHNYGAERSTPAAVALTGGLYAYILGLCSIYPGLLYWRYCSTKGLFDLIYEKQQQLITISHAIKSMHALCVALEQNQQAQKLMPQEYGKLKSLFSTNKKSSQNLQRLVEQLMSSSFDGNPSYFLSQPGKVLATHKLLTRIKHELVPYFEAWGQVDAYLTVQGLYQRFQHHPKVTFCIPTIVQSAEPIIAIDQYWHPLIDPGFVVTNSLTMGNNDIKNLMITGPNAGGKTTSLMSLIINIIFAQSFGIAPSAQFAFTPFAKIHSYLDITTNLQEGLSLFAAEVDRAKKLKQSILSCTPGQKTFTIIDEIFSGTNPQVASDVGFTFAAQLGEMKHSMTIITTHFPRLTDLEKETNTFTNYKVADATIMPDGKVVYPFKLVPGISTQNIAQHMLQQQGVI